MDLETLSEYDTIEQKVEDGELCSKDGEPCDFEDVYEDDRDGTLRIYGRECRKCGEPPRG